MQLINNRDLKWNPFVNCTSDFVRIGAGRGAIETYAYSQYKSTRESIMISFWKLLWVELEDFGQIGYVTGIQGN